MSTCCGDRSGPGAGARAGEEPVPAPDSPRGGDLVFVADAHLRPGHAEVGRFVSFLADIRASASVLFLLGDLFDTWFGSPDLQKEHHLRVVAALREQVRAGVRIRFVEGNREFRIARGFLGDPFERVAADHLLEPHGGHHFFLTHGDLINVHDRQYRLWRRFAKSPLTLSLFGALPASARHRIIDRLERTLQGTNHRHRKRFPLAECREFAARAFARGADVIVLGHFHEERVLRFPGRGGDRLLFVVPAWCEGGGYLRFRGGEGEFIWADGRRLPGREIALAVPG
ncbi:MAG: UDP-2,3-diacylglucosamine diphosphatase [Acidobacteria bacterium]|nr:UDP-2,3-diacylglucosamine diphosphatase [Acidobacteriota bacterium]